MIKDKEKQLIEKIQKRDFFLSIHAQVRMTERNIVIEDIVSVAENLSEIKWQDQHESYLIKGLDLLGENLFVAADIEDDVIIITVFYKDNNYE